MPAPPKSAGRPLGSAMRAALEPRFGHNFADVRVHADAAADQLAQAAEARAFTTGQHIYFSQGTYDPASPSGLHLLAHELAHTIQQSERPATEQRLPARLRISHPADPLERTADAAADSIFSGAALPTLGGTGAQGGAAIQREERSREPSFKLMPPQLQLPIGPLDLQANTSSTQLGYTNGGFNANLGYNYGDDIFAGMSYGGLSGRLGLDPSSGAFSTQLGYADGGFNANLGYNYGHDIFAGMSYGDFSGRLGVDPSSGAFSLGGAYDQFQLGANANRSGEFGLNLHYGAPLLNFDALERTMREGGTGAGNALMALPGGLSDPFGYAGAQGDNIKAAAGAFGTARDLAKRPAGPSFGLDASLTHRPASGMEPADWRAMLMGGLTF